jgi:hypothetical protein
MMHESNNPRHSGQSGDADLPEQASAGAYADTPESAVPTQPAPEPVHRWLDGESVNSAELDAPDAEKHVKFWAKVNAETERRRRLKTPSGLDAIIMDKLSPPIVKDD